MPRDMTPAPHPAPHCTLTADESATRLTAMLIHREPFYFIRYGDGALECMYKLGKSRQTCDSEAYSDNLGLALLNAWGAAMATPNPIVGDWLTASFEVGSAHLQYEGPYKNLIGDRNPGFLHFETLLLHRESPQLFEFYQTIKHHPGRKVFMGPPECAGAARMMGARHVKTPISKLFRCVDRLLLALLAEPFDVLLYGAGMAGNIPAALCAQRFPERTYINLGSAMDPLFRGTTRLQQLSPAAATKMFKELL